MSESTPIKPAEDSHSPQAGVGFYVYCIVESKQADKLITGTLPDAMEDDANLELVSNDDVTAVVSRVPLSTFGEEALAERVSDAAWMAIRAMRHEHVVEYFSKRVSVVPLRFGTIYLDRAGIEQMLAEKSKQLLEIIRRLGGREEWGVNVYTDRAVLLENITNVSSRLREMAESAKQASPGQSYLIKKKIEVLRSDEAKVEVARAADEIEGKLATLSDAKVRLRVLKVETTEHGELKAKFAFLVNKEKFDDFRKAAEQLANKVQASGIRIELTGPWPAYNFALA